MIVEAASGRIPAFVDTGLNIVHVDDVAHGHCLAFERGRIGERYILGGQNMTMAQILGEIASLVGRSPPRLRLHHDVVLPIAHISEAIARLRGKSSRPPFLTVDGVRMAKKRMHFDSAKAETELGYQPRPSYIALADAVAWFQNARYLR